MRFDDAVLIAILAEQTDAWWSKLTAVEWASLEATEAKITADLHGMEEWFEACYTWRSPGLL